MKFQSDSEGGFSEAGTCRLAPDGAAASCKVIYTPRSIGSGTHKITASYQGEGVQGIKAGHQASAGTASLPVTQRSTQTAVACTPAGTPVNTAATCTITVTDTTAAPSSPGGAVKLQSDGPGAFPAAATCTLAAAGAGKAACQLTYTPGAVGTGSHKITASYGGELNHQASQGSTQVAVSAPPVAAQAPNTLLKKKPRKKTAARTAKFTFASDQPGVTFQCKLDKKAFKPCRSPFKAKRLKAGRHSFQVKAVNAQGLADPTPAVFRWKVR